MDRTRGTRTTIGAVVVALAALAVACAPAPGGPPATTAPTDPVAPVVDAFSVAAPRTEAPVTATFRWRISDANGDPLTCAFDLDGDSVAERTVSPCPAQGDLLLQYRTPGTITPTLTVSDGALSSAPAATGPISVTPGPSEPFDITLTIDPAMAPEYRAAFEAAAARWEQVIVDGWNPEPLSIAEGLFGWVPAFDGNVDDVLIAARAPYLDGPLGLLGQAGAIGKRASTAEPYFGIMEFDSADLERFAQNGRLNDLVLHEMGHILGIGFNWVGEGRVDDLLTDPTYNGPAANAAWHELGGTGQVPVEDGGGVGTFAAHWRESTFDSELMTGYSDGDERMSRVTIGALADRGYGVDLDQADPYQLPGAGLGAGLRAAPWPHQHTVPVEPLPDALLKG
ncbi:leishmanolysin-related zinc metalloendopeptidase [Dermatobacter hominis]|uniref:leishmanolysin-related zinc metalloendopeptidase n=1 Tax=Dermatobacter hominis TaxID=2884263 RepID=UPI001D12AFFD|nr:leishmanolysin-related zinc metalloendopeptidase [Dermatobacter hominis]UDY36118.1 hypothetical protein LH044_00950 [Dermatobacter hominis]